MKTRLANAALVSTGIVAALIVGWLAVGFFQPREPVYHGKPLSFWLEQLWTQGKSEYAQTALRAVGPRAIPILLHDVRQWNSSGQRLYRVIWPRLPQILQRRMHEPKWFDEDVFGNIVFALSTIGEPGLPMLLAALEDSDQNVRRAAVEALKSIAPKSDDAARLVGNRLADPNPLVRYGAVTALAAMKPHSRVAIPALIHVLRDSDAGPKDSNITIVFLRAEAAKVLGELGPQARAAVPELRRLLQTGDGYDRLRAAVALWRIGRDTNSVPVLIRELRHAIEPGSAPRLVSTGFTCKICFEAFAEMGSEAKVAVPVILDALRSIPNLQQVGVPLPEIMRLGQETLVKVDPYAAEQMKATLREGTSK